MPSTQPPSPIKELLWQKTDVAANVSIKHTLGVTGASGNVSLLRLRFTTNVILLLFR